jgi:hypothetical protein
MGPYTTVYSGLKYQMGGACNIDAGVKKHAYKVSVGNLKGRGHLEVLGVDGRIILRLILE